MLSQGSEYKKTVTLGHLASILNFMGFREWTIHAHTHKPLYIYI